MKTIFSSKTLKWGLALLLIVVVGLGGLRVYRNMSTPANGQNVNTETYAQVEKGNLEVKITGAGTVEPILSHDIVPLVKGSILSSPYEVGELVKKDDFLYEIDYSDLEFAIEKTRNSIEKLKINNKLTLDNIDGLKVYAPCDGRIENLNLKVGDKVVANGSKIANIVNDSKLSTVIPFNKSQVQKLSIGKSVKLLVSEYMTYVKGVITYISSIPTSTNEGITAYDVEIEIQNPGVINEGTKVTAIVEIGDSEMVSQGEGNVSYLDKYNVNPKTSGNVKEIFVKNNDWVAKGEKLLELEDDNLYATSLRNKLDEKELQVSLESQLDELNDYKILSPIDGTVIEKNFKLGDTLSMVSSNTVLMTVADMSKMKFTIDIDELDIAKIVEGLKVNISADALPDTQFKGEVTSIPVLGKSQNGVTTYPVEVTIEEPGRLKPGMNINSEIIVESKRDVLYVPMSAITKIGNKTMVFVKNDFDNVENDKENTEVNQNTEEKTKRRQILNNNINGIPCEVTVGINTEDYIEIIRGLKEGDTVVLPYISTNNGDTNGFPRFGGENGFEPPSGSGGRVRKAN